MGKEGQITRRDFIIGAGAAATLSLINAGEGFASRGRPNFVFILTDDHRWDAMSCMGHPFLWTPNMDRLAREGARFANAFVTTSLCSPSRASFLTGRYPHSHGVRDNFTEFSPTIPTFPLMLQRSGYETAFIGKWHMSLQEGVQPGFDRWVSFKGQGTYENPVLNIDGRTIQVGGYITDLLTRYAIDWLRERGERPFCLYLSHKAAHADFIPAIRHSRLFEDVRIVPPKSISDTLEGKPEWVKGSKRVVPGSESYGEFEQRVRNYARVLAAVDEGIGRVLETLETMDELDSTVIVLAGDNGFLLGEHGLLDKRAMYEESIRIPLLMRYPPLVRPGTMISQIVLNIDICPTFLDLAGVPGPKGIQGRSVRPLLEGRKCDWRSDFLYVYEWDSGAKKRPPILGVRTERWKYITYPGTGQMEELYDLKNDPLEMRNLISNPSSAKALADMRKRLQRLIQETGYFPVDAGKMIALEAQEI